MRSDLSYAANCSLLFTEVPLVGRPAAARAAGFDAVEFWWPWPDQPVPPDAEVDAFVRAVRDAGVRLVGLNLYGGDLAGADAGVLSLPARAAEFRANLPVVVAIGAARGVPAHNALYGVRVDGVPAAEQDELARENLTLAAQALAANGATVLVEPLSGPKPYPLRTARDVVAVLDRLAVATVALLLDLYHLAANGDDLTAAITAYAERVGHVQLADHPGRGEPGTGTLDLDRHLSALVDAGYSGYVAAEYVPTMTTPDSLGWFPGRRP